MSIVGFFRELREGRPDGPSIEAAVGGMPADLADKAASYLRGGTAYVAARQGLRDYFGTGAVSGVREHLTDGRWVWPGSLAFYVERYRVGLPSEFVEHMAASDWKCPRVSQRQLAAFRPNGRQ